MVTTRPDPLEPICEAFHLFPGGVTVCVVTTRCGFSVLGQSTPSDPSEFSAEAGKRAAQKNAKSELAQLRVLARKIEEFWESEGPPRASGD